MEVKWGQKSNDILRIKIFMLKDKHRWFRLKSHLRVFNSDKNFRSKIKEMKFNMQIIIKAPRMAMGMMF